MFLYRFLGDFKRRLPRTPSTGTMSSADDLDEREPPSPSDIGKIHGHPPQKPSVSVFNGVLVFKRAVLLASLKIPVQDCSYIEVRT